MPPALPEPSKPLTPREKEVLSFLKCGFSTKEISEILTLALGTVEFHANKLRIKMGFKRVKDLRRAAIQDHLTNQE